LFNASDKNRFAGLSKDYPGIGICDNLSNGDSIPNDIIGAEIIAFGAPIGAIFEGGGLIVDYKTKDGTFKRLALEFNELGMWANKIYSIGV
jgi:hypothetical protein